MSLLTATKQWPPGLQGLANAAVDQAVLLDAEIVAASRLARSARRLQLATARERVAKLDATALRLLALRERPNLGQEAKLDELVERVDVLEAAHEDLDQVLLRQRLEQQQFAPRQSKAG